MQSITRVCLSGLALVALAGCSLIPEYQRPAAPVAGSWPAGDAYQVQPAAGKTAAADLAWKDFFQDEKMRSLIELALKNNRDLRVAALNIESARAQYQIQRAALFPAVNASMSGTNQRIPASTSSTGQEMIMHSYSAGLGFSAYELDLFGRLSSLKESALENYFALEATQRSAQISLVAEVANAYLTLLADRELLALSKQTLQLQQETLDLTQKRLDLGVATDLDRSLAESTVQAAKVEVASYTGKVAQDENALALLVGAPIPADLISGGALAEQGRFADVPAGLPSDLLARRPDILAAEHSLKAANANIGAARARFFPSISLTANAGVASGDLGHLFGSGTGGWLFSPSVNLPIFNAGSISAGLDQAKVAREINVAQYEKAIQTAFREVSDSLSIYGTISNQLAAQEALVKANQQSETLSQARYKIGVDSYLTLMVAQRTLFNSQQNLVTTRLARASNLVTLYKVLGGGWQ